MARKVNPMKANPAAANPIKAIAVTGFFSRGIKGLAALKNTPRIAPAIKAGYLETVVQKLCMIIANTDSDKTVRIGITPYFRKQCHDWTALEPDK
jgi:hypothetical protein